MEEQAREAESFALAVPGVTNSEGGSASWSEGNWRLVTSEGFEGAHRASGFSISASAIAGEGSGMERGGEWRSVRHRADLPAPSVIGADAGARAVAGLGARKISSTTAAVVFENRLSSSLLGPLLGAISGPSVARGVSCCEPLQWLVSPAAWVAAWKWAQWMHVSLSWQTSTQSVIIGGREVAAQPLLVEGRAWLPVAKLAAHMGLVSTFDYNSHSVTISKPVAVVGK